MIAGVSAGHYTAYAKHVVTGKWYYFNDSNVTLQEPVPSDDRAYILFYDKIDPHNQENNARRLCLIDQPMVGIDDVLDGEEPVMKLDDPPKKIDINSACK